MTAVSIIQKLPEIARSTTTSPEVLAFYEHLTRKNYNARYIIFVNLWFKNTTHTFSFRVGHWCTLKGAIGNEVHVYKTSPEIWFLFVGY